MGQIEKNQTKKIHTYCTNKSRIQTHSAISCLFNRRSTAGRLSLCNDYKISKRLLFEWWTFPSFTQERCMCRPKKILRLKISNLSSMILPRLTTVLHKKQMIFFLCWNELLIFTPFNLAPNLEMYQTT